MGPWNVEATPQAATLEPEEGLPHRDATPLQVCLAALNFYPVYAGPAIRFSRYLPKFRPLGISMRVLAGTPEIVKARASGVEPDWTDWEIGEALPPAEVGGAPVQRVRLPDDGGRLRARLLAASLVEHCRDPNRRPDVIQLLACGLEWIRPLRQLRRWRIPVVYTATMLRDFRSSGRIKRLLLERSIAFPMQFLDGVVVSSEAMRERMPRLGVRTPVHVIPNGVDTGRFRPPAGSEDRGRIRQALGIGPGDTMALFVGPIVARKGIELLLEAWARACSDLPRLHLVLAGPRLDITHPANRAFHERIHRMIEASSASGRVHFTGMIENVEEYMRAADVFVFPSRREGMPNVVPEAMASGLPVVMTPFIGLPSEFGRAAVHYRLVDFDADSLADGIAEVVQDRRLREEMGSAARTWTEQHLGIERSVERYAELYRQLARGRRAEGGRA